MRIAGLLLCLGEIAAALHQPAVEERLQGLGLTIVADTPEQFARFVAAESEGPCR